MTFTVFTATYNRAHTLGRAYESLRSQTFRDFEWLIVDDGSTDGTADLVARWRADAEFDIRYLQKSNEGKHTAFNLGVREARGALFVTLDSDDTCFPESLATFRRLWESIPAEVRSRFANVTGLCVREDGSIVGRPFPADVIDAYSVADQVRLRSWGERWGINRTDVLRQYAFPVFAEEKWVPEAVVWNRISIRYASRFVNEPVRVYRHTEDSLSAADQLPLRLRNPRGTRLYYEELMALPMPRSARLRAAINYCRFSFHAGDGARVLAAAAPRGLVLAAAPFGYLAYLRDRRQLRHG